MRDILRSGALGRSLAAFSPLDRVAAAWPVVVGHAIARHSEPGALKDGVLTVFVRGRRWLPEVERLVRPLRSELARSSKVHLADILFLAASAAPNGAGSQT